MVVRRLFGIPNPLNPKPDGAPLNQILHAETLSRRAAIPKPKALPENPKTITY